MATDTLSVHVYGEGRYLPATAAPAVTLLDDEPLALGLSRITQTHFGRSVEDLRTWMGDAERGPESIEDASESIGRLRSVLRLVRSELGSSTFRAEDQVLRKAAALLEPAREATTLAGAVGAIRQRHAGQLRPQVFAELHAELERRRDQQLRSDPESLERACHLLRRAQARYAAWPVSEDDPGKRRPIRHEFASIRPALEKSYGNARSRHAEADRSRAAADFDRWLTSVRHLGNQLDILHPLWPEIIGGTSQTIAQLTGYLREEHDLANLLRLLAAERELVADPTERSLLIAVTQQRRAEVHQGSTRLGARVFAETPDLFCARFSLYWDAWNLPATGELVLPR